jgi:taurine--2-oxoglutarate transaminase
MNNVFNHELPCDSQSVRQKSLDYSLFTWSPQKNLKTIEVKKAEGCYYWDYDGKKYFDLCSQLICVNIGHGNKKVIEAIKRQAETLTYIKPKFTTDVRGAVAEKIINCFAPSNMKKVLFSLGGAESNEYAIRLAKTATGRSKVFSQYNSYHGATYGAANLCGDVDRNVSDPQIGGFIHFFGPNYRDGSLIKFKSEEQEADYYLKLLEDQLIFEGPSRVAAIFLE